MMRMTDGQLDKIHNRAIQLKEKSDLYPGTAAGNAYACQSIAASNLVIIELLLRQGEKKV
ncbi:MAG: hypothetical protein M0Q91_13755 [Methanoregula sp.]|nr:hypothetical protein [Methanoregula sp.]